MNKLDAVYAAHPHLRKRRFDLGALTVLALRRSAVVETGEQKLAFAVIEQAIKDAYDYSKGRPIRGGTEADAVSAVQLIKNGCAPWAGGIGLDPEYIIEICSKAIAPLESGLLQMCEARIKTDRNRRAKNYAPPSMVE